MSTLPPPDAAEGSAALSPGEGSRSSRSRVVVVAALVAGLAMAAVIVWLLSTTVPESDLEAVADERDAASQALEESEQSLTETAEELASIQEALEEAETALSTTEDDLASTEGVLSEATETVAAYEAAAADLWATSLMLDSGFDEQSARCVGAEMAASEDGWPTRRPTDRIRGSPVGRHGVLRTGDGRPRPRAGRRSGSASC